VRERKKEGKGQHDIMYVYDVCMYQKKMLNRTYTCLTLILGVLVLCISLIMTTTHSNNECISMERRDVFTTPSMFGTMLNRQNGVSTNDAFGVGDGKQHYLWITPVSVWTLRNTRAMNMDISKRVKDAYLAFKSKKLKELGPDKILQSSSAKGINELFFSMQRDIWEEKKEWWDILEKSPYAKRLRATIWERASVYMSRLGRGNVNASGELFLWATACETCISHLPHVHEDSLISGTYYVNVPKGSGSLIFQDPRGVITPFGGKYEHIPEPGQIVMFPPWLQHGVSPSCLQSPDEIRVSLSFNIIGKWTHTSDVSVTIDIP
jgi:hypothetical protein